MSLGDGEHDVETFENLILSQVAFCARVVLLKSSHSHSLYSSACTRPDFASDVCRRLGRGAVGGQGGRG